MPHQCTGCGHTFEDGSKEMLSGCPSCGGKKFQFLPPGAGEGGPSPDPEPQHAPEEKTAEHQSSSEEASGRVERAASAVRGLMGTDDAPDEGSEIVSPEDANAAEREDSAQAAARSTVVSREELPESSPTAAPADEADEPDLESLRRELNEQFESIKILEPGQYELNLMELFDRDERIIAIEEDGRYVIDVPDV